MYEENLSWGEMSENIKEKEKRMVCSVKKKSF